MPSRPDRPRRVLVAGLSGSGKTTLADRLASLLDVPLRRWPLTRA